MPTKCPFEGPDGTGGINFAGQHVSGHLGALLNALMELSNTPQVPRYMFACKFDSPSTIWALKMPIFGAFLKIESSTKMGCYNLFQRCIE